MRTGPTRKEVDHRIFGECATDLRRIAERLEQRELYGAADEVRKIARQLDRTRTTIFGPIPEL